MKKVLDNNTLLLEKIDEDTIEMLDNDGDKKFKKVKGMKIFRIVQRTDTEFVTLASYNPKEDRTDLTKIIENHLDKLLVSVDKDSYGNFVWMKHEMGQHIEVDEELKHHMITITGIEKCDEEECKILDELYPEYYDNAY